VTGIGAQAVQNLRERFTISGKHAGAAESASSAAKAPEASLRTTEQTAKRGVEIGADTTRRSADTAAEARAPAWRGMRANAQLKLRRRPARAAWRHLSVGDKSRDRAAA
jgi:hypothetical protein